MRFTTTKPTGRIRCRRIRPDESPTRSLTLGALIGAPTDCRLARCRVLRRTAAVTNRRAGCRRCQPTPHRELCARQLPTVAIFAGEVLVGLSDVGDLHLLLSHSNAGAQWFSLKTFRLYRIATPASAMASEQLAAFRKLPADAGPPLNAATHSVSPPPPPPRPPRPPCGCGNPLGGAVLLHLLCRNQLVVQDHSLVADEQSPGCRNRLAILQLTRPV